MLLIKTYICFYVLCALFDIKYVLTAEKQFAMRNSLQRRSSDFKSLLIAVTCAVRNLYYELVIGEHLEWGKGSFYLPPTNVMYYVILCTE